MPSVKLLYVLLIAGVAMCLAQIWWPHYYLTGDGPCHLYNAKVLHDIWNGHNESFYKLFYRVQYDPNPNWLSNILLGIPLYFFEAAIAEKIFITLYASLLISGFYLLIKKISGDTSYWLTVVFLFVFHHTLAKGFYNFSLATALWFWMVWSWLKFIDKKNTLNTLLFFTITGITFFAQLLPFVFGVITCFCLIISYSFSRQGNQKQQIPGYFFQNSIILAILVLPYAALMLWFTNKEGGTNIILHHHFYRLVELVQFKYGICAVSAEEFLTSIAGITIVALIVTAIIYRSIQKIAVHKYDGFFYSMLVVLFVYLFFPEDFMHRAILISMRAQLFVLILAAICIAYTLPQQIKDACGLILFTSFAGLSLIRMNYMNKASEAAADYNSVSSMIKPNAVVLPLDFAPQGVNKQNKPIVNRNYLFTHALHYSGCEKPMILLDNYEANAGYFPLQWLYQVNPYVHLSKYDGIEAQPPGADIREYMVTSGVSVDYIVLWCYNTSYLQNAHYSELNEQICSHYHLIYTSPTQRTMLYEKNK